MWVMSPPPKGASNDLGETLGTLDGCIWYLELWTVLLFPVMNFFIKKRPLFFLFCWTIPYIVVQVILRSALYVLTADCILLSGSRGK
jgi:hypothetical protein